MSKSILVIDTPENCGECDFCHRRLDRSYRCTRNENPGNLVFPNLIPHFCPLLPLPEKLEKTETWRSDYDYLSGYRGGWNNCIDKIIGEENDTD